MLAEDVVDVPQSKRDDHRQEAEHTKAPNEAIACLPHESVALHRHPQNLNHVQMELVAAKSDCRLGWMISNKGDRGSLVEDGILEIEVRDRDGCCKCQESETELDSICA